MENKVEKKVSPSLIPSFPQEVDALTCHEEFTLDLTCLVTPGQPKQLRSELYSPCIVVQYWKRKKNNPLVTPSDCGDVIRVLLNFYAFDLLSLLSLGTFLFFMVLFGRGEEG